MRRAQVSSPSQLVRNLSTNPSFETASGTVDVRTNLATNPSFEAASGTVDVRKNLFNGSTMLIGAGASQTPGVLFSGDTWTRLSTTADGHGMRFLTNLTDLVNGATYATEWEVANDGTSAVSVTIDWCDQNHTTVSVAVGERKRIKVAGAFPTYSDTYRFADLQLVTANTNILYRQILIEKEAIQGSYFDGSTTAAGDFTYAWTGAANTSTSVQKASTVQSITGGNCYPISSTEWKMSGAKSLRIIPSNTSFDSFASIGGDTGGMRAGLVAGKTYTVSATCRLAAVQSAGGVGPPRAIVFFSQVGTQGYVGVNSGSAPNAVGSTRLSVTYTIPSGATEAFIRLYNGVSQGNGEVWWDDILIEETSTLQPYFDGANLAAGDFTYAWTAGAHASTSVQQAPGAADVSMVSSLAVVYQSKLHPSSGTKALRITPVSSTTDTFAGLWASAANSIAWKPNTTYTIAGDRTIIAPQTNPSGLAFRVNIGTELNIALKAPIANVAGTQRVVGTFTTGTSTVLNFLRLYNGAAAGGGDVWWDNVIVTEGNYEGPYVDGSKPFSKWDGTPNASTSVGYPYG